MSEEKTDISEKVMDSARRGAIEEDGTAVELTAFEDNTNYPWERQPGEPNNWYDIFFRYYTLLGPGRNIARAYRAYAAVEEGFDATGYQVNTRWYHIAMGWRWKIRAEAFDEYQRMRDAEMWESRRRKLREKEWGVSNQLLDVAEDSLEQMAPKPPDTQAKGIKGRVRRTGLGKASDVARFAETGSKLGRLASGMATDQTQHINIHARMEEVRKQRWETVAPLLEEVVDGVYDYDADQVEIAGKDVMAGGAVGEPPKGLSESADNRETS